MENTSTSNARIYTAIALVIVLIAGYLIWSHRTSTSSSSALATSTAITSATSTAVSGTTTISSNNAGVNGIVTTGQGGYTVNIVSNQTAAKAPDYTKPIVYSASISPSFKAALQEKFNQSVAAIAKDKFDFNAWIDLGAQHHMAGDDQAAATIWEYASLTWPTNVASFNNLGDLYANFLKNYAKAESNFLTAIKNKPSDTNPYRNLFTLYYSAGYNKNKAEAILKQGIAAAPKAVDMQVLLARYYRDTGRTAEAKAEYSLAIINAQSQNQASLATAIQTERDAF